MKLSRFYIVSLVTITLALGVGVIATFATSNIVAGNSTHISAGQRVMLVPKANLPVTLYVEHQQGTTVATIPNAQAGSVTAVEVVKFTVPAAQPQLVQR